MNLVTDIVIIGGGPAGLSIGSELSKKLNIVLVEKNKIGESTRGWFVPKFVCEGKEELKEFLYEGVRKFICDTFSGAYTDWKAKLDKGYYYIKEHELLSFWGKQIEENGSLVIEKCEFLSHKVLKSGVVVETTSGRIKAKMIIDASGYNSKILEYYNIADNKEYYWWSIMGCIAEHSEESMKEMEVGDYMLWQTFKDSKENLNASLREGRPVFEYNILDSKTSFPLILYLTKEKIPYEKMEEEFFHILKNEKETSAFKNINIKEMKYGWYPSGGVSQRISKDRVAFVGDAGCWSTPCGWGMGFILNNYKVYANNLIPLVEKNKLSGKMLNKAVELPMVGKHQILIDQLMVHFLSNGTVQQLDKFINFFNKINPLMCEKLFTLSITTDEILIIFKKFLDEFGTEEILRLIPKEDYFFIAKEIFYFINIYTKEKKEQNENVRIDGFVFKDLNKAEEENFNSNVGLIRNLELNKI